jgi:hypothetical protein
MTHSNESYKGFNIQKRTDVKTHTCIIYKDDEIVKCIAGNIFADGSENAIAKAKIWIDNNSK